MDTAPAFCSSIKRWLSKLGVDRPELRAWAWYDWANSAVWVVGGTIFPIYFSRVAAADLSNGQATEKFAAATTVGLIIVALTAPLLGALADLRGLRKRMLACFLGIGAAATVGLYFIERGDWRVALVLFILIELGLSGGGVFYDALLPHLARGREVDSVSATAYAWGYLGGGVLLTVNLAWILWPRAFGFPSGDAAGDLQYLPFRFAFVSAAVWWVVFSVPLFRQVHEPGARHEASELTVHGPLKGAIGRLSSTVAAFRRYPQAFRMLLAFLVYSDGIGTIARMAAIYGTEIGVSAGWVIGSLLVVQFTAVPFVSLAGLLSRLIGPKRTILVGLAGYAGIAALAFYMTSATQFLLLALGVAVLQGGTQALSRSLFASLIPRHRSAEFFSFFAVSEKFAGILGPALFAAAITMTGSSRYALLSLVLFFIIGAALLSRVDVAGGRRDVEAEPAPDGRSTGREDSAAVSPMAVLDSPRAK